MPALMRETVCVGGEGMRARMRCMQASSKLAMISMFFFLLFPFGEEPAQRSIKKANSFHASNLGV